MNAKNVLDMSRILIKASFVDKKVLPTSEDIYNSVQQICSNFSVKLDDSELKRIIEDLNVVFSVEVEGGGAAVVDNQDHVEWLSLERKNIDWKFWNRYEKYLFENKGLPDKSIKSINRTTDKVLSLLENPNRSGQWDRRGLVVGSVQSGKTGNYTGLICKAADAGYKVIVVLAGIHNDLRAQSQLRLDEGFLGYETSIDGEGKRNRIGVGEIDPEPKANTITNRSENGDFQRQSASKFNIEPEQIPLLFVVKKNKSILDNLNSWVANFADSTSGKVKDIPILIVDDEADQASVDTKDDDPSTINKLIRKLLNSFEKSSYVGYTATPFANVLIGSNKDHIELGEDLFPKSFITSLPIPDNYVGPQKIFSTSADEDYPIIKELTDDIDNSTEWIPAKHKKDLTPLYHGQEVIPPCLERAIKSFILTIAIRNIRGDESKHNSMLIHVTRFNEVQEKVADQVMDYVDDTRSRITLGQSGSNSIFSELEALYKEDYIPTTAAINNEVDHDWEKVKQELVEVINRVDVKIINGSSKDGLDYLREDYPECVIAIGGDKLSRGLTLEGLSVSYFLRQSKMYDTLMQMGRWFGYRPRYADLCRLFTNNLLVSNFQSILNASEELVEELNEMSSLGMTPKDFGLKVKVSPGLLVTNKLKMRDTLELDISFASGVAESTSLNPKDISNNWSEFKKFIENKKSHIIGQNVELKSEYLKKSWKDILYLENIPGLDVANLMLSLKTHESSRAVIPEVISKYITEQLKNDELTNWTIVVHSGTGGNVQISDDISLNSSIRKYLSYDQDKLTFRRLASKNDEFIDIKSDEISKKYHKWAEDLDNIKLKDVHSRMIRPKERGLLMFYIITPVDKDKKPLILDAPIIGFMISFPRSQSAKTIKYRVNSVWIEDNLG